MSNSESLQMNRKSPVPVDQCGAALATEIISDRWSMLILREAFYRVGRFDDIQSEIGIPRSVLTDRLKKLVSNGILTREPYREAGSRTRTAYLLSQKGRELGLVLLALMQWGDRHLRDGETGLSVTHKETGQALVVGLVPASEPKIGFDEVTLTPTSSAP